MRPAGRDRPARQRPELDWLDQLRTGIVLLTAADPDRVDYLNPAAQDVLGASWASDRSDGDRTGHTLAVRIAGSPVAELLERAQSAGRAVAAQDIEWSRPDGSVRIDVEVTPIDEARFLIELSDASLRRRAASDRERAVRRALSRRVVRQLAHEIRNPLGGLRGAAQLLDGPDLDQDRRELVSIILREADRLAWLIDELLEPGRRLRFAPLSIHRPLEEAAALLHSESNGRPAITRDYDPSLPTLSLDADAMVRVFVNLARNAFQAGAASVTLRTRAATRVTLAGRVHSLAVAAEVIDDGPGVPESLADSLFFPLVTGRSDGAGLGLAIVQELVDRHGGQVDFESRPGRTVFRVLLPVPE